MTRFTIRGHDLLAVERFRDDTRYMVEFEVLEDDNLIALRGETARLFLSEQGYQKVLHSQELGKIHITDHALVVEGHIILTSLFRTRILEDGNPAEDAMDYLGNIDFHALTQAVQDKARTAYTYITQGMQEKSFNYRGPELFGQKATLLYVEDDQSTMEIAVTTRTLELWLLEDMSLVCVACVRVEYEGGEYVTEYRTIKGDAAQSEMCLDLEDLSDTLDELCGPCFESTSCKKRRRSARRTCPRWALLLPPKRIFTRSV